jgi:hypothetical protein
MNAYTTTGQARIQSHDLAVIRRMSTGSHMAAASLAALERQRGWQAETEVDGLLRHTRAESDASTSRVSTLRLTMGRALVRAGERLAGVPRSDVSRDVGSVAGTLSLAD